MQEVEREKKQKSKKIKKSISECEFSNLGLSNRYKIRRYKIQDIETAVAVWFFTYLVSLYLVSLYLCISPTNCNFTSPKPSPATKNDLFSEIVPFAMLFCSPVCKPGSVPPRGEVTTIYLRGLSPRRFTAFAVRHPVSGVGRADPPCGLTRCCIG